MGEQIASWPLACDLTDFIGRHRVPGHMTRYSVSANEISLAKESPIRSFLLTHLRPGRKWFKNVYDEYLNSMTYPMWKWLISIQI